MAYRKLVFFILLALVAQGSTPFSSNDNKDKAKPLLTIEKIMSDPKWIGSSPGNVFWSEDGKHVFFYWNREKAANGSLYMISKSGGIPKKVPISLQKKLPSRRGNYNRIRTKKVYEKNGDIFLLEIKNGRIKQITNTLQRESNPQFSFDEKKIFFQKGNNLFSWNIETGIISQLTDFRQATKKKEKKDEPKTDQEKWLKREQLRLIQVLKKRSEKRKQQKKDWELLQPHRPKTIYLGKKSIQRIQISPDERFITFTVVKRSNQGKNTIIPNYVTESAFTEDIVGRTKVGVSRSPAEFQIYDIQRDTVYSVKTDNLPGIFDQPDYLKARQDQPSDKSQEKKGSKKSEKKPRSVYFYGPLWSPDGKKAIVVVRAHDNKDFWITLLNCKNGNIKPLYRYHDEAWIGVSFWRLNRYMGWLTDSRRIWFQSEESGYNHLYTLDVETGTKKQLTGGKFEIYSPRISRDDKYWYFSANKVHPGERHFYRMNLDGSHLIQITRKTGSNRVYMSPDEKTLAVLYSYTNKPWELFLMPNKPGAKMNPITHSVSKEFLSYPWRDPEIVTFKARDGAQVYGRLYRASNPQPNGPAVIFVHGAGYLQNAHKWWSVYFREYMFHNLLADNGYTVLDIDYRGSAGYGRDWRTAIYRHMGGKDLSDQVDGAKFLIKNYQIDPKRIGIYGGSYGGFITLMAMFTEPNVFAAGAALRPVTDWAHYSHSYTSNILNVPYADSLAYARSSPIYFAEGLKGALLICHGMVDVNVHFQDVVRLAQRLIELGKENWQVAIYPVEGHGFREPSSWTDEYKRIFKLFEENLKK